MDISIKFDSAKSATMTIDGREFRITRSGPETTMHTPTDEESFGGMVAALLFGRVSDIMDAAKFVSGKYKTWEKLPESVANDVYDKL